jgi:hypothetical protein
VSRESLRKNPCGASFQLADCSPASWKLAPRQFDQRFFLNL